MNAILPKDCTEKEIMSSLGSENTYSVNLSLNETSITILYFQADKSWICNFRQLKDYVLNNKESAKKLYTFSPTIRTLFLHLIRYSFNIWNAG